MPLSAGSTGGHLPNKRGKGRRELCASYKTDNFLCLMEPELLTSGCPGVPEGCLGVCILTGDPEGEAMKERCLHWAGNSWLWEVPELCCCPGRHTGITWKHPVLAQSTAAGHCQPRRAAGCAEGSFGTSLQRNDVSLLDFLWWCLVLAVLLRDQLSFSYAMKFRDNQGTAACVK